MKTAARLFASMLVCLCWEAAFADDLDVIADSKTTPEQRGEAYERLTHADFSAISVKLAKVKEAGVTFGKIKVVFGTAGSGQPPMQPWNQKDLDQRGQIYFTLSQLWDYHMNIAKTKPHYTALLVSIMENPEYGDMRGTAVWGINDCLHVWKAPSDPSELSKEELLKHLDTFARDPKNPVQLREDAVLILCKYTDPNPYVEVGAAIMGAEENPAERDMPFPEWMNVETFEKLTKANQHLCIRQAFKWLKEMDDTHPGQESTFAGNIGRLLGMQPGPGGNGPFVPDRSLPKYQGKQGGAIVAEDTVKNALAWWAGHHAEYEDEAAKSQ